MVKNEKQHIEKTRAKQGFPADSPEPYKIAASTPFDFGAKKSYALWWSVPRIDHVGETGLQETD